MGLSLEKGVYVYLEQLTTKHEPFEFILLFTDFTFFQLPQISNQNNVETSLVFGIACFQQISSSVRNQPFDHICSFDSLLFCKLHNLKSVGLNKERFILYIPIFSHFFTIFP